MVRGRSILAMLVSSTLGVACHHDPTPQDPAASSSTSSSPATDPPGDHDTTASSGCDPMNDVPEAPVIIAPSAGARNVEPGELVIESSPFVDPNGDPHATSEFEIWRVSDVGLVERVWAASSTDPESLTRVTLADGELLGTAAVNGALREWDDHVVRVRYGDDAADDCGWSEWSTDAEFRTDDGSQYLFDQTVVRDIYLDIPAESMEGIDAEAVPPGCVPWSRAYYPGTVTYEGQVFEGAGLRAKGGCGSAVDLSGKTAFRINLEWDDPDVPGCPDRRRLYGQKHLSLNNMVQDETFSHERLAYRVYQAFGVPTPRVAHVRVHVNGELWGLYLLVETPKRRFLGRRFESNDGMLYEGTYWCDLVPENVPPGEEDDYCLERKFSPSECDKEPDPGADPEDYQVLRDMVDEVDAIPPGGFYPEVEGIFEFDEFLSAWAVEGVVGHWDNHCFEIMNNYRVYRHPATDRWHLLPHGVDQTFERDVDPWAVEATLCRRCVEDEQCEAAFAARLAEVNETFEGLDLIGEVDTIFDLISDDVFADPRKPVDDFEYEALQEQTKQWLERRPDRVREILEARGF